VRIRADITVAAAAAALEVAAVAASAASQLSPFEPPQEEERTSPADDCGRENEKPSTLRVCHRRRSSALALEPVRARPMRGPHRDNHRPILRPQMPWTVRREVCRQTCGALRVASTEWI
jgi:hypothetical protein